MKWRRVCRHLLCQYYDCVICLTYFPTIFVYSVKNTPKQLDNYSVLISHSSETVFWECQVASLYHLVRARWWVYWENPNAGGHHVCRPKRICLGVTVLLQRHRNRKQHWWEDGEHWMDGRGAFNGRTGNIRWTNGKDSMMDRQGALDGWTGSIRWEDGEHSIGRWGAFNDGWAGSVWWMDRHGVIDGWTGSIWWTDREASLAKKSNSLW